jgi:hypothetical protein
MRIIPVARLPIILSAVIYMKALHRWIIISAFLSTFFASWIVSGAKHIHPAFLLVPLAFLIFAIATRLNKKKPLP